MDYRLLRQSHWLALFGACSTSACGGNKPETPDAFVAADVQDTQAGGMCNVMAATTIVGIGAANGGTNLPTRISNGGSESGGATVNITCSVVVSGSGFDIQLDAEQFGPGGGNLRISSPRGQGAVTTSGGTVSATFTSTNVGSYSSDNCTLTYTYNQLPVPTNPPVAAGRIWGHISCPAATENLTSPVVTCDAEADFMFENCSE